MTLRQAQDERIVETGFADPHATRSAVRRMKLRLLLIGAMQSISATLDLLDKSRDPRRDGRAALRECGIGLAGCDQQRGISGLTIDRIESDHMREQQLLQGVDLILQLLDTLGIEVEHGLFSVRVQPEDMPPAEKAHRLSGGAQ